MSLSDFDERASYNATFVTVIGNAGRRIPLGDETALRLSTTLSYIGEWTDDYSFEGPLANLLAFEVDEHFAEADRWPARSRV